MTSLARPLPLTLAAAFLCVGATMAHAQVRANVVLQEGDSPPGANGAYVVILDNPFLNGLGQVGFVGTLSNGDHFVWVNNDIVWRGDDETTHNLTLTSSTQRQTMGHADDGSWVYLPDMNGRDTVWTNDGPMATWQDLAPGYSDGERLLYLYRPRMIPSGELFFIANIDTDGDTGTEARALYVTPDRTLANAVRILATGDLVDGIPIEQYSIGVDTDYNVSDDGSHYISVVDLATGSSVTDGGVVVDGSLVAQESTTSTGFGDQMQYFDIVAINNQGNFMFSGDSNGTSTFDEYLVYNGSVAIREGDTVDGQLLNSSSYVYGMALNNLNAAVHMWYTSGANERLFYASDAANLKDSSRLVLRTGDSVDLDGDGDSDGTVTDFNTSSTDGPGLALSDAGVIYVEVDLDTGSENLETLLAIIPSFCGDGVVVPGEECDDGAESATCNADCTFPYCGDGIINMAAGEGCDGAGMETADCDLDCTLPECGDGTTNTTAGEVCDTGEESELCDIDCTAPECGDGVVNNTAGEDCDEGAMNTANCDEDCTAPMCGDGIFNNEADEDCDTGSESITCDSDCTAPACGDEVVNMAAGEDCDTAGINTAECNTDCTAAACGDGYLNLAAGEECDGGGATVDCDDDCTRVSCGDGNANSAVGEECDDMGESGICDADCTNVVCGDLTVNATAGEECDDGNAEDGDGCSALCVIEGGGGGAGDCECTVGVSSHGDPLGFLAPLLLFGLGLAVVRRRRRRDA